MKTITVVVVPFDDSSDSPLTTSPGGHVILPSSLGVLDGAGALGGGLLNGDEGDYTVQVAYQAATFDRGDISMNGVINATDIDLLAANDGNMTNPTFDLNGDGEATYGLGGGSDSDVLITDILGSEYGDANLDGKVNSSDAAILGGNFGTQSGAT